MKKSKAAVILVAILAAFAGLAYYASIILSSTGIGEEMSIPLGLDLSGGVSITYQVMDENPSAEDMSDTIYKLQKRVESYSTEASVYQVGDDRIAVEIPGVTDASKILEELGNPGSLEFQLSDGTVFMTGDQVADAQAATTTDQYGNKQYVVQLTLTDEGAKTFGEVTSENVGNAHFHRDTSKHNRCCIGSGVVSTGFICFTFFVFIGKKHEYKQKNKHDGYYDKYGCI